MKPGDRGWRRIEGNLLECSVKFVGIGGGSSVRGAVGEFARWSVYRFIKRSVLGGMVLDGIRTALEGMGYRIWKIRAWLRESDIGEWSLEDPAQAVELS